MARTYLLKVPFTENDGSLMLMHVSKNGEWGNVKEEWKECLDVWVKSIIKDPLDGPVRRSCLSPEESHVVRCIANNKSTLGTKDSQIVVKAANGYKYLTIGRRIQTPSCISC